MPGNLHGRALTTDQSDAGRLAGFEPGQSTRA
jgi:hypothetical protein